MARSWLNPGVDKRKGDRHAPGRKQVRTNKKSYPNHRWESRNVVGWDGEGCNLDGVHVYNLLANSNNEYIHNEHGLSTASIFEFFLARNPQSAINVIFSGGYDVNMILKDLQKDEIETLWRDKRVIWRSGKTVYRITYKPRKVFSVAKYNPTIRRGYERSFVLWDVFGFYQSSFVKACRKWLVDDETIDTIDEMKQRRSDFTEGEFDSILDYCFRECKLLVLLCQELFKALDQADLRLTRYDGAGAIASAMLKKNSVKAHIIRPPDDIYRLIQISYAGGRIEAPQIGNYEGPVWKYDKNSAYPAAMIHMPSWHDVSWETELRPHDDAVASLVAVEWNYTHEAPIYPLFYRTNDGTILFPRNGSGIYWKKEFDAMAQRYREGVDYEVLYTVNAYSENPIYPLVWLQGAYDTRLAFKRQGNMAQEALKLGINSVYGKFAQQEGYVKEIPGVRRERFPAYHCLAWASMATSWTRADLYTASCDRAEGVIAFATDAVISRREIPGLYIGNGLGEWSLETYSGCTIVQAGVYWLKNPVTNEWESKYRGFDPDSLYRDAVMEAWGNERTCDVEGHDGQQHLKVRLTRFMGMGSALNMKDFWGNWRTWQTDNRCLDLIPQGKRLPLETNYANKPCRTVPTLNVDPSVSYPYPVIWMDAIGPSRPTIDGIPLRVLEDEYEESFL